MEGKRSRGRPRLTWEEQIRHDLSELHLSKDMISDRSSWRHRIKGHGPTNRISHLPSRLQPYINQFPYSQMLQPPGRYANSSYASSSNLPQSSYSPVVLDKPVMVLDEATIVLDSTSGTSPSMV
ncbi:hypothetical protein E3N88_07855 [Mikania micrantha]|uniref:Uncharacterized protein n=1 Tax=Mikania micrantha TaxID=192012 RepID=A0A5N6PEJ1_9ASTR|nr:hypothetical protein E3N88_07855 [Mikania micrantha]